MEVVQNRVMSSKNKEILIVLAKCIIFTIAFSAANSLIHAFNSAFIEGVHGKPSFVSDNLMIFSIVTHLLFAIGYLVLGNQLPIANPTLRGFAYIMLIWISNYLPQVMGLAGADGEIASVAFSTSIVICDSIGYLFGGLLLGLLFRKLPKREKKACSPSSYLKTILLSGIVFPILVIILDQTMTLLHRPFSAIGAVGVSDGQRGLFYLIFYGCFIVSGIFIAVFYRMTEYNRASSYGWLIFGLKYDLLLWTPIVLIMIIFDTEVLPTVMYSLLFLICILGVSWMNGKLLK